MKMNGERKMKRKQTRIISMSVVGVLLFLLVIFFFISGNGNKDLKNHIDMGNKYMEDLDYEQALAEYKAAFEIAPQNKDAVAGIENVSLQYADSVLVNIEAVSMEELNGVVAVLEEMHQLIKSEPIKQKTLEIKMILENKKVEEDKKNEEIKLAAEEAKKMKEDEKKKKEKLEKEIQKIEDLYIKILEWANQVYKTEWKQYYWNTVYQINVTDVEGEDSYKVEVEVGASQAEYYVYEINKETLQGKLVKFYAEDFNGGFTDEIIYTDKPIIDFSKYTGESNENIKSIEHYQLVIMDTDKKVKRKKEFYLSDFETGEYGWYEYGENEVLISQWQEYVDYTDDKVIEGWVLTKYTDDGELKYTAHYDKEKNLIDENSHGLEK